MTSSSEHALLLLDSDIRDWVVIPLLIIMITAGLLRHYLSVILRTPASPKATELTEASIKSLLLSTSRLRCGGGGGFLTESKWQARQRYYCGENRNGHLHITALSRDETNNAKATPDDPMAAMPNPAAMMDGMKGNMAFMVQNMVMMQGISHFFHGYVLLKVPFALTNGFKGMFQRGLELNTLDTSYVSSVSWYFLVMYGLRGFFQLIVGPPKQEFAESTEIQNSLGNNLNPPPAAAQNKFDGPKYLRDEAERIELYIYSSKINDAERRLLGERYPKAVTSISKGFDPNEDIFGFNNATKITSRQQQQRSKNSSNQTKKSSTSTAVRQRKN